MNESDDLRLVERARGGDASAAAAAKRYVRALKRLKDVLNAL
jgi:hypothetical protein